MMSLRRERAPDFSQELRRSGNARDTPWFQTARAREDLPCLTREKLHQTKVGRRSKLLPGSSSTRARIHPPKFRNCTVLTEGSTIIRYYAYVVSFS